MGSKSFILIFRLKVENTQILGYSGLGTAVFFPIVIQALAAKSAYEASDHSLPCDTTASAMNCVISIAGYWMDTSSFVYYTTAVSVIIQFFLFLSMGSLADHGGIL